MQLNLLVQDGIRLGLGLNNSQIRIERSKVLRYQLFSIGKKRYLVDMETNFLTLLLCVTAWLRSLNVMEIDEKKYLELKSSTKIKKSFEYKSSYNYNFQLNSSDLEELNRS